MIYIEGNSLQHHSLSLGKLGSQKTYTISGAATFDNGLKTITTNGIQSVGVDIQPNIKFDPTLVLIISDASIVEVFCVLCPSGRYWNPDALKRVTSSNAVEQLALYDVTAGTRKLISTYGLTTEADWLRDMMLVSDFTAGARLYGFSTRTGQPIAYRADVNTVLAFCELRNALDERTLIFVSADRFFRFYNHVMTRVATTYIETIMSLTSAAFTENAAYLAVIDQNSVLHILRRNGYNFSVVYSNSDYEWKAVHEDGAYQHGTRFRCTARASCSFVFDPSTMTLTRENWSAYGTAQTTVVGYPVVLTPNGTTVNGVEYPVATPIATNSDALYLATADGKVIDASGSVILQASNPVALYESDVGLFVVEQRVSPAALTFDTSAPILSSSVAFSENGVTVTINVTGGEPRMLVVAPGTIYVNGIKSSAAYPGSTVRIEVPTTSLVGGKFAMAVGRSALLVDGIVDRAPDQFFIADIAPLQIGEKRVINIALSGFNAATEVTSNGIVRVDGVISDTISPGQDLTVEVQQSGSMLDTWWVTVGTTTAKFRTLQVEQPITEGTRSRAYAPLGVTLSDPISNTYGVPTLIALDSDAGNFVGTSTREILLAPGQSCEIVVVVSEHIHYDIPYTFGKTAHTFSVWADSHFLDPTPVTEAAERYVVATCPAFSFASIPDNFYMIATAPAGVDVILNGEEYNTQQDGRQVDSSRQLFEFDNKVVLQFRGIPCAAGRPLDFGDCVASWEYPVIITGSLEVTKPFSLESVTKWQVSLAYNHVTRSADSVAPIDAGSLVAVGLYAFENAGRSANPSAQSTVFEYATQELHAGLKFDPQVTPIEAHSVEAASSESVYTPSVGSVPLDVPNQVTHTISSFDARLPLAVLKMQAEYDPLQFSVYQIPSHLAAAVNFRHADVGAIATGQPMTALYKQSPVSPTQELEADRFIPQVSSEWGTSTESKDFMASVCYTVELETASQVAAQASQADMVTGHRAGFLYYDVDAIAMDSQRQEKLSVPLRHKLRSNSGKGSGEVTLQAVNMKVVHSSNFAAYIPEYHSMQMLQWASLVVEYGVRRANDVVDLKACYHNDIHSIEVELAASAVMRAQCVSLSTGFDVAYSQVHDYSWCGVSYVPVPTALSYPRMDILTVGSITHNGNPDLLDRGYFSSEVLALQDALQVWKMDPATIAARQLPSGEWYWIQVTTCANMCQGCPPTGYLSGG